MRRIPSAAAALLMAGVVVGCGSTAIPSSPVAAGTGSGAAEAKGSGSRVVGTVQLCGGPLPGRCLSQPTTVSVLAADGSTVGTRFETGRDGRFSIPLAPGDYTLALDSFGARGEWPVRALAGASVRIDPVIPIP